ncbi:hypothetical protein [Clostridium sp.]|jgi:hypothetical protein|uniref:hypothetical protein n=1 Tax=Clostridium sp. TaxID=1506 RepID=UPI0028518710|nr:hypothetical protein [Clostridium sp.]MDR3595057.1 hypothetical protein [Clostridium sp.]
MQNITSTYLLTKTATNLLKTTGILLLSNLISQELRNSTKSTNDSLAQNIRYWRNRAKRT